MSTTTKTTSFGSAVPINAQRPMLAAVGQAVPVDAQDVPATVPASAPDLQGAAAQSQYAQPSWTDLLIDASLSTIKAGAIGAGVGAALSTSGKRSKAIVRGATVSATVSPIAVGLVDLARIQIADSAPDYKAAQRAVVLKTNGIALALGAALLGIDYALNRVG